MCGDWNVNFAPSFADYPYARDGFVDSHCSRRDDISSFVSEVGLDIHFASRITSLPASKWAESCLTFPFTRVPQGEQVGLPSLLDFIVASRNTVESTEGSWKYVPSDHCLVYSEISCDIFETCRRKTHWDCSDWGEAREWVKGQWPSFETCPLAEYTSYMFDFLSNVRDKFSVRSTSAARRYHRFPLSLRLLYFQLAQAPPERREHFRMMCWHQRLRWVKGLREQAIRNNIDRGRAVSKSKKLFWIKGLEQADGRVERDDCLIANQLAQAFSEKYGAKDLHQRSLVADFVRQAEGKAPFVDEISLERAFGKLKRKRKLDTYGICVNLLYLGFESAPDDFLTFFRTLLSSEEAMSSLLSPLLCFGKSRCVTPVSDIRAIVPLTALLQLVDRVLSLALHDELLHLLPSIPGCMFGGRIGTQARDIGHGVSLLLEKGADRRGGAAVAQGDVRKYFDNLPLLPSKISSFNSRTCSV